MGDLSGKRRLRQRPIPIAQQCLHNIIGSHWRHTDVGDKRLLGHVAGEPRRRWYKGRNCLIGGDQRHRRFAIRAQRQEPYTL